MLVPENDASAAAFPVMTTMKTAEQERNNGATITVGNSGSNDPCSGPSQPVFEHGYTSSVYNSFNISQSGTIIRSALVFYSLLSKFIIKDGEKSGFSKNDSVVNKLNGMSFLEGIARHPTF